MSKKRNGKKATRVAASACERCGCVARASVMPKSIPNYDHKLGTIGLPSEDDLRPVGPAMAFQLAKLAGIVDEDGNLMPDYQ